MILGGFIGLLIGTGLGALIGGNHPWIGVLLGLGYTLIGCYLGLRVQYRRRQSNPPNRRNP